MQSLNTSVASSPYFNTYLAAQVYLHDKGFLSRDISVADLIRYRGDVHHIFPRDLLKRKGLKRGQYNQIANYVYMQSDINIHIGNQAPKDYFGQIIHQCETGTMKYGNISDTADLYQNIEAHCIPKDIFDMTTDDYQKFLEMRRKLIANKLRLYYESL